MNDELIKNSEVQRIAREGKRIYKNVESQYNPEYKGKFLAIDPDSEEVYLGETSVDAVRLARQAHPGKVFYLAKIGFDFAETMASIFPATQV